MAGASRDADGAGEVVTGALVMRLTGVLTEGGTTPVAFYCGARSIIFQIIYIQFK